MDMKVNPGHAGERLVDDVAPSSRDNAEMESLYGVVHTAEIGIDMLATGLDRHFVGAVNFMMDVSDAIRRAHGFVDGSFAERIALIHSELSEALEADRKEDAPDKHCPEYNARTVELADAVIRIFDTAKAHGLPLAEAIIAKTRYNHNRPYKHGGKKY